MLLQLLSLFSSSPLSFLGSCITGFVLQAVDAGVRFLPAGAYFTLSRCATGARWSMATSLLALASQSVWCAQYWCAAAISLAAAEAEIVLPVATNSAIDRRAQLASVCPDKASSLTSLCHRAFVKKSSNRAFVCSPVGAQSQR